MRRPGSLKGVFNITNIKSKLRSSIKILFSNRRLYIGSVIFATIAVVSIVGEQFVPSNYVRIGRFLPEEPPGKENVLGTDSLGRDVLATILKSTKNSLTIGLIVATVGTVLGAIIGFVTGYSGGTVDATWGVIINFFLSVPSILFLILISALVKSVGLLDIGVIIAIFSWAGTARGVRAQTLSLKEREFINVSKLSGMNSLEIITYDIMPHMAQWLGAHFINSFLGGILAESSLAILGLSSLNEMTLGIMLFWCNNYNALAKGLWWWWGSLITMLILTFVSLYLVHIGLDEIIRGKKKL